MSDTGKKNLEIPENNENIIDINMEGVKKQRYRINGGAVLELDTADVNIATRLKETYPKLNKLAVEATSKVNITDDMSVVDQLDQMSNVLQDIDVKMRKYLDYIFDAPVSETCANNRSLYTLHNGKFMFEYITETLGELYAQNISAEASLLSKRLREHTDKYTGKIKRRK